MDFENPWSPHTTVVQLSRKGARKNYIAIASGNRLVIVNAFDIHTCIGDNCWCSICFDLRHAM